MSAFATLRGRLIKFGVGKQSLIVKTNFRCRKDFSTIVDSLFLGYFWSSQNTKNSTFLFGTCFPENALYMS